MPELFDSVLERVNSLKKEMGLSDKEVKILTTPKKINKKMIEVNGKKLQSFRILFNDVLGPGKGGIRFHPKVNEDEVKSLAFWMMLKNSLAKLPYGGAKGGVSFDPKRSDEKFIQKVSRAFIDAHYENLGQDIDVPAPDVYTNSKVMAWMLDQYEKKIGHHEPAMITGKPIELGGLILRGDSTARGGFIVIKELLHHVDGMKKRPTVAIQGFGNAGKNIARMLYNDNFKIVAVSDSKGGIFQEKGLDINDVIETKNHKKSVTDCEYEKVTNEELLELNVDILVLAALESQITIKNAEKIKARHIIELANGPVSPEADKILYKKNVDVVPDILANSGGVIVSYFEWAQNKSGNVLDEKYFEKKLFDIIEDSWHRVYELYSDKKHIDLRTAAYILAVERILKAEKLRGNL